jgi:LAO/AO transport system kinase
VPGLGDDVQAIKAGLLEIADVHVVNKADRDGAQRTYAELRDMLRQVHRRAGQWNVPIVRTVATQGEGVVELMNQLDKHRAWLERTGELQRRARQVAALRIQWAAEALTAEVLRSGGEDLAAAVDDVLAGRLSSSSAARKILSQRLGNQPVEVS